MATDTSLFSRFSSELTSLVDTAGHHVVGVSAGSRRPASGLGIGGDLVVTADHVVEPDRRIEVFIGDLRHEATVVGRDRAVDLAVLRVPGLSLAEPATAEPPAPGSLVVSVARTGAGTLSAGLGVITSVGGPLRTGRGVVLPKVIRTDAAMRPGTAGGVIVDAQGRVLGVTTPGLLRGLPVAIPSAQVLDIARRLVSNTPAKRAYLGVSVQPVTLAGRQSEAAAATTGLLVFGLASQGAADRAGLLVGDILIGFDGQALVSADQLQDTLAAMQPGAAAAVDVIRGGVRQTIALTTGERAEG